MAGQSLAELAARINVCTLCRLHETRTHAVPGEGPADAKVLLIGEGPGRREDEQGRPFVGTAGRILNSALEKAALPRTDAFITNAVKCRPPDNRKPRADEIASCRAYLLAQIEAVRPAVIVTLGDTALKGLIGPDAGLAGARRRRLRHEGIPVIATYHPAGAVYNRSLADTLAKDLARAGKAARSPARRMRSGAPRPAKPVHARVSSGAAVFNAEGRVLLLRRADEGLWCLPKGTQEAGESLEETAIREVREESGLEVRLLAPLTEIRYGFYAPDEDVNVDKRVMYYLAERVGGALALESLFEDARWCTRAEALRLLHYENDRRVVHGAFEAVARSSGGTRGRGRGASS